MINRKMELLEKEHMTSDQFYERTPTVIKMGNVQMQIADREIEIIAAFGVVIYKVPERAKGEGIRTECDESCLAVHLTAGKE